jgi:hypothetical protein
MSNVTLVAGPPCSGKTTWVNEQRGKHDIVIDADLIAAAIGSPDTHGHQQFVWDFVRPMMQAAIDASKTVDQAPHVWIIKGAPTRDERLGFDHVVVLEVDKNTCRRRALDVGRPDGWGNIICQWWARYQSNPTDTVIRG